MPVDGKNQDTGKAGAKCHDVYQDIRSGIEKGRFTGVLPGVRELAQKFDVNFMTVDRAIKKLEVDGFVYRVPRKGTYAKRQYNVAICFNDPNPDAMSAPVYYRVVMGAQRYFSENNCPMFLEGTLLHQHNVVNILRKKIDGFLFFYNHRYGMPEELLRLPCVRIMGDVGELPLFDHVGYNNSVIGKLAAEYVLSNGCRSGAFVGPTFPESFNFTERYMTFAATLEAAGCRCYNFSTNIKQDYYDTEAQIKKLLAMNPLPESIFCPSDSLMLSICIILYRHGIRPNKDIQVVACNNMGQIILDVPDLFASVDIRSEDIGALAAEQLLKRIKNPKSPVEEKLLEPRLVIPDDIRK